MTFRWILGPCSMESEQVCLGAAETLSRLMEGRDWFFKASFDKANRTSIAGARGPGLDEGLRLLAKAKELFPGIRLTTDVHEPWQVPIVAPLVDMIQVPAFLGRQTDLLVECARHSPIVNVKKGQWMSPWNIAKTVDKIKAVPGVQAVCTSGRHALLNVFIAMKLEAGRLSRKWHGCCAHHLIGSSRRVLKASLAD